MRSAIKFAIAWIALAALLASILGSLNIPTYIALIQHGERTTATITKTDCNNHSEAAYTFTVGTTRFSSKGVMWMYDCQSLHAGDSIQIYYDRTDPTISRAFEPHKGLVNDLIPIALACLTAPPMMIAGFIAWYRKNRAK
jgi:Protein of unknown function (DUF3592)